MQSITNTEFLNAIIKPAKDNGLLLNESKLWVCSKLDVNKSWGGSIFDESVNIENPDTNNYFNLSTIRKVDGKFGRKKENFDFLLCVTLDDIGTKSKTPTLEPTYIIETSSGNEQWGYLLKEPISDITVAEKLFNSISAAGYTDDGAKSPATRYMRLPVGINDKPEHVRGNGGKAFQQKLKLWKPDQRFTVDEIHKALGCIEGEVKSSENALLEVKERQSDSDLIKKVLNSDSYHPPLLSLAARYINRGLSIKSATENLQEMMKFCSDNSQRWQDRYNDIPRLVETAYKKYVDDKENTKKFRARTLTEFISGARPEWAIKHLLPKKGVGMIYGESGSGKTFFSLDVLATIARGIFWNGKKVKQSTVIYIPAEGHAGAKSRLDAYIKYYNLSYEELPILVIEDELDLTSNDDEKLIEEINRLGGNAVIIIDTLAQVSAGANENSGEDMGKVLKRCQNIQKETDSLILLVHHTGKDKDRGARGWSGLKGAMDVQIEISLQGDKVKKAKVVKLKDGEEGQEYFFELEKVTLGFDEDDEEITSCIVKFKHETYTPPKKPSGTIQRAVFNALNSASQMGIGMSFDDLVVATTSEFTNNKKETPKKYSIERAINDMLNKRKLAGSKSALFLPHHYISSQSAECEVISKTDASPHLPHPPIGGWKSESDEEELLLDILQ